MPTSGLSMHHVATVQNLQANALIIQLHVAHSHS